MKKGFFTAGIIIICLSIGCILLGGFMSDWNLTTVFSGNYDTLVYNCENEDIKDLQIEFQNANIILKPTSNEKASIEYFYYPDVTEVNCFEAVVNEDTYSYHKLFCTSEVLDGKIKVFQGIFGLPTVTIYVPTTMVDYNIKVTNENGEIRFNNQKVATATISTTSSMVSMNKTDFSGDLSISTTNAYCKLDEVNIAKSCSINTTNGYISVDDTIVTNTLTCKTANGYIKCGDTSAVTTKLTTTNGAIETGNLTSSFITATTTNGAVNIRVVGNKGDFEITKINDDNNQISERTNTLSNKTIYVKTTNGSVNVNFD